MDEATFNKEVAVIQQKYAQREEDRLPKFIEDRLPKFIAESYQGMADAEKLAVLADLIGSKFIEDLLPKFIAENYQGMADAEKLAFLASIATRERLHRLPQFIADKYQGMADAKQLAFLADLIDRSEKRKEYWDTVNLIARQQLRRGLPLPAPLASWIKDVLADQSAKRRKEKKRRPRPAKGQRIGIRDQNIRLAIENLIARGYRATRSGSPRDACAEGGSACDVAGAAFGLNYKNTEGIWGSREKSSAS